MTKLMWRGYLHQDGYIYVKRWFGDHKHHAKRCEGSKFIQRMVKPFEANSREEALLVLIALLKQDCVQADKIKVQRL